MASKEAVCITYKDQPMDCVLHPVEPLLGAGLISGRVQVHRIDASAGTAVRQRSKTTHVESCRAVAFSPDGTALASGSADGCMDVMDTETGKETARFAALLAAGVSRLLFTSGSVLASGADDGDVKLVDTRVGVGKTIATHSHHSDFISDFAHVEGKRALLATSGDGSLSVLDLRSSKVQQSETDADDELLALAVVKGGAKVVVGSQSGMLDIWSWGRWAGFSDRFPGHPSSVDSLVALDQDTVITGSADGLIRVRNFSRRTSSCLAQVLSIQPHKMLGVVGQHTEEEPVERLSLAADGSLLASAGHDSRVRIWSTRWLIDGGIEDSTRAKDDGADEEAEEGVAEQALDGEDEQVAESDSEAEGDGCAKKRKRRKKLKSHLRTESSKKTTGAFFRDLL